MWGFQAAGAAPDRQGHPVDHPETIATAIRIGNPASWHQAVRRPRRVRRPHRGRHRRADPRAHRLLLPARASSSSRRRRRRSPGCSRPTTRGPSPGPDRRLHRHGPRAQGPPVGTADRRRLRGQPIRVPVDAYSAARRSASRAEMRDARGAARHPRATCGCPRAAPTSAPVRLDRPGARPLGRLTWPPSRPSRAGHRGPGEGAGEVPLDERHLVYRTMLTGWHHRGRGSGGGPGRACAWSAATPCHTAAGSARRRPRSSRESLPRRHSRMPRGGRRRAFDLGFVNDIASQIEGHPDNASASVYGGLTLSWSDESVQWSESAGRVATSTVRVPLHAEVAPVVFVPSETLSTAKARSVLPSTCGWRTRHTALRAQRCSCTPCATRPSCCCRRRRSGCTRRRGARPTRTPWASSTRCGRRTRRGGVRGGAVRARAGHRRGSRGRAGLAGTPWQHCGAGRGEGVWSVRSRPERHSADGRHVCPAVVLH